MKGKKNKLLSVHVVDGLYLRITPTIWIKTQSKDYFVKFQWDFEITRLVSASSIEGSATLLTFLVIPSSIRMSESDGKKTNKQLNQSISNKKDL